MGPFSKHCLLKQLHIIEGLSKVSQNYTVSENGYMIIKEFFRIQLDPSILSANSRVTTKYKSCFRFEYRQTLESKRKELGWGI